MSECSCTQWFPPIDDPDCPVHGSQPVPDAERVWPNDGDPED